MGKLLPPFYDRLQCRVFGHRWKKNKVGTKWCSRCGIVGWEV